MTDSIKAIKRDLSSVGLKPKAQREVDVLLKRAYQLGKVKGSEDISQAARDWVAAEVMFRLGPLAYGDETTSAYIRGEEALRKAVVGASDLRAAAKHLGLNLDHLTRPNECTRKQRRKR